MNIKEILVRYAELIPTRNGRAHVFIYRVLMIGTPILTVLSYSVSDLILILMTMYNNSPLANGKPCTPRSEYTAIYCAI